MDDIIRLIREQSDNKKACLALAVLSNDPIVWDYVKQHHYRDTPVLKDIISIINMHDLLFRESTVFQEEVQHVKSGRVFIWEDKELFFKIDSKLYKETFVPDFLDSECVYIPLRDLDSKRPLSLKTLQGIEIEIENPPSKYRRLFDVINEIKPHLAKGCTIWNNGTYVGTAEEILMRG